MWRWLAVLTAPLLAKENAYLKDELRDARNAANFYERQMVRYLKGETQMAQAQSSGVVDTAINSAKAGVDVVKAVVTEGMGGATDVANATVDLGQEYVNLLSEGGQITAAKAFDLINDLLERMKRIV